MTEGEHFLWITEGKRREVLEKARDARAKRAELKRRLSTGELKISEMLMQKDDRIIMRSQIKQLIIALPGIGKANAFAAMEEMGIEQDLRVSQLSQAQKDALVGYFG